MEAKKMESLQSIQMNQKETNGLNTTKHTREKHYVANALHKKHELILIYSHSTLVTYMCMNTCYLHGSQRAVLHDYVPTSCS